MCVYIYLCASVCVCEYGLYKYGFYACFQMYRNYIHWFMRT